jgi:hypothetical protein
MRQQGQATHSRPRTRPATQAAMSENRRMPNQANVDVTSADMANVRLIRVNIVYMLRGDHSVSGRVRIVFVGICYAMNRVLNVEL